YRYFSLSYHEQLDLIDERLSHAIDSELPQGKDFALLFSGGLDSRMLGGYLKEKGFDPIAQSFGSPRDIETLCATAAARILGLRHAVADIDLAEYPSFARLEARWRHLSGGFSCIFDWQRPGHFGRAELVVSGYALGTVFGASHFNWGAWL